MASLTRERVTRGVLVGAALAAVLLTTLGAGYRASKPLLSGSGAFLQRQHQVVHMNAESQAEDAATARALATGKQRLEVVEVRPGSVWIVNKETGEVSKLDTDDMRPERVSGKAAAKTGAPRLVAGGDRGYLVYADRGVVSAVDGPGGKVDVQLGGPVTDPVVDSAGTLWVLSRGTGELISVAGGTVRGRSKVAEPKASGIRLSLVRDRPVVYDAAAGRVVVNEPDGSRRDLPVPKDVRPVEVPAEPAEEGALVAVVRGRGSAEVRVTDVASGETRTARLEGHRYGRFTAPVVLAGKIYVPDQQARMVVVMELASLRVLDTIPAPAGTDDFDVFVRDGRVWVNDPYAKTTLVFDREGRPTVIDSEGEAVKPSVSPSQTPKPTTRPTQRPPVVKPTRRPTVQPPVRTERPPRVEPTRRPSLPVRTERPPTRRPTQPPRTTIEPTTVPTTPPPSTKPSTPPDRTTEVPNVVGRQQAEACRRVRQAKLKCALVERSDPRAQTGQVLETRPGSGTKVQQGSSVTVVVAGTTKVPPVVGKTSEQACQAITAARLVCKAVPQAVADAPEKLNQVHAQSPAPETALPTGREVTVHYYPGDQIVVPNVVGADPASARATLARYGLGQGADNAQEVTPEINKVHAQSVAPGTPATLGTPVGITYQTIAPVGLHRFKLQGHSARFLTYDNGPTPSRGTWNDLGIIASVYAPGERGVPGLVDIEEWRCNQDCGAKGRDPAYTYRSSDAQDPPDRRGGPWELNTARPGGRPYAFACFSRQAPQPAGTRVLRGMYRPNDESWAFAVEGSGEYNQHIADGFGGQPSREFTICYVW